MPDKINVAISSSGSRISKTIFIVLTILLITFIALFILNLNVLSQKNEELFMTQFANYQLRLGAEKMKFENDSLRTVIKNNPPLESVNLRALTVAEVSEIAKQVNRKLYNPKTHKVVPLNNNPSTSQIIDKFEAARLVKQWLKACGYEVNKISEQKNHKPLLPNMSFFITPLERPSEQDTIREN